MGSHWVFALLYFKNVLYWPEDDRLRSKHVAITWPDSIYNITVLIYCCVYNTLYKFVNVQRDGLCQIHKIFSFLLPFIPFPWPKLNGVASHDVPNLNGALLHSQTVQYCTKNTFLLRECYNLCSVISNYCLTD